jgi:hypothetical protein
MSLPSVAFLTHLLSLPLRQQRTDRLRSFLQLALSRPPSQDALSSLRSYFGHLASLPIPWRLKDTLWHMANNSIPGSLIRPWTCPCCPSVGVSPTMHSFWTCPIASHLRALLSRCLNPFLPISAPPLTPSNLWLGLPPPTSPPLVPKVWWCVCLAALDAMELGRRLTWSLPNPAVDIISPQITTRFWDTLHHISLLPSTSSWNVPPSHPFISSAATPAGAHLQVAPLPPAPASDWVAANIGC